MHCCMPKRAIPALTATNDCMQQHDGIVMGLLAAQAIPASMDEGGGVT